MISCLDLYTVCYQLSIALSKPFESFGNKNVVLAGDFDQLLSAGPNVASLYSSRVPLGALAKDLKGQQKVLGKAI